MNLFIKLAHEFSDYETWCNFDETGQRHLQPAVSLRFIKLAVKQGRLHPYIIVKFPKNYELLWMIIYISKRNWGLFLVKNDDILLRHTLT
jgi:hypothetical protein